MTKEVINENIRRSEKEYEAINLLNLDPEEAEKLIGRDEISRVSSSQS